MHYTNSRHDPLKVRAYKTDDLGQTSKVRQTMARKAQQMLIWPSFGQIHNLEASLIMWLSECMVSLATGKWLSLYFWKPTNRDLYVCLLCLLYLLWQEKYRHSSNSRPACANPWTRSVLGVSVKCSRLQEEMNFSQLDQYIPQALVIILSQVKHSKLYSVWFQLYPHLTN